MKVLLQCHQCLNEFGLGGLQPAVVQMNDERAFDMICPKGHKILTVIQQPKYEVLFEVGMNALVDGYSREAVTAFASSLEVYYEFCIRQLLRLQGVNGEVVDLSWKLMAKQSERQLGAFLLLWLNSFGSVPSILGDKTRGFRNKVVHQGYIPTAGEAIKFGDAVVECIRSNLRDIRSKYADHLEEIYTSEFICRAMQHGQQVTTMSIPTTISWLTLVQDDVTIDLVKRMAEIEGGKVMFQWPKF
ncbi:hypothetical protein [Phaeobacter gallaeciensis]|uniref:hypothetical protein n=1 Tax=Phaeobacter gallaeciensis TaxID=60890 RepID=UPI00237F2593|nr:hypothetical protein [Phaeobacter gallaeciensis]MDE4099747.1 hypothetical protein [Phaeobacter gallaeciensis]MDE4108518.1 hypothetical protein [Phaeobacter gallaeciensis]MDE4110466.1 hypothetical protein [Phaeobacter gallaeciensis]MDE4117388.1 hypothetical protein [Phaeobacter gallaeciensis]